MLTGASRSTSTLEKAISSIFTSEVSRQPQQLKSIGNVQIFRVDTRVDYVACVAVDLANFARSGTVANLKLGSLSTPLSRAWSSHPFRFVVFHEDAIDGACDAMTCVQSWASAHPRSSVSVIDIESRPEAGDFGVSAAFCDAPCISSSAACFHVSGASTPLRPVLLLSQDMILRASLQQKHRTVFAPPTFTERDVVDSLNQMLALSDLFSGVPPKEAHSCKSLAL